VPLRRPAPATTILALVLALGGARSAGASCGAESCPLDLRAAHSAASVFSLDLGWQYVRQDQVRVGTRRGAVGEPPSPEDEVATGSRVTTVLARLAPSRRWSLDATLPFVDRTHRHVRNEEDAPPAPARWDFSGLGDLQLMAEWRPSGPEAPAAIALRGGVKLPTGRRHVAAVDGDQPEPPARPGTGSWDGLAGVHVMRTVSLPALTGGRVPVPLFTSALVRVNGRGEEDYRVGNELQLGTGGSYPVAGPIQLLLQLNARFRGHDGPGRTDALGANTGGTWVFVSPGLRIAPTPRASAYAYVMLPVYQRVNRSQIVAPWLLYTGVSWSPGHQR